MSVHQTATGQRPWSLGFARTMLLVGAFLTGLYLSESFGEEENNDDAPALRQPLAQVDR